jgi:hypothetical protein
MPIQTSNAPTDDRSSPLAFAVPAGLIAGLVWICMLLAQLNP